MRSSIVLTIGLSTLVAATPLERRAPSNANVVINATTAGISNPDSAPVEIPAHIAYLAHSSASITKLQIKAASGTGGIDANNVRCRMYKDVHGTVPGSLEFSVSTPADVSTNPVEIGSILCYVVEEGEAQ